MTKDSRLGWLLVFVQVLIFIGFFVLPHRDSHVLTLLLGAAITAAGGSFLVWSFLALGSALTANPVPRKQTSLRTQGPYSYVRHPIYTGVLVGFLGYVVAFGSLWTLAWWVLLFVFFFIKSRWEDSMLSRIHGAPWYDWERVTPGLIPFIRGQKRGAR